MNKYPEAASVVQHIHKMLSVIEILATSTLARVGESSQWTTIVNSVEENRAKFCKFLDGKPLFSVLYSIYMVTLKELKAVLKVNALKKLNSVVLVRKRTIPTERPQRR
jgi:hypothetical protein